METWNDLFRKYWVGSSAPAVVTSDFIWSGDQLARRAGGASNWLDTLGFTHGQPVPMVIDESADAIALAVGATLSGRVPAPLGTKLPASDLAAAIANLGATVIVAEEKTAELCRAAAALIGASVAVMPAFPEAEIPNVVVGPDEVALIIHTSGTTGLPKPIPATHERLCQRIRIYTTTMGIGPGDRYCSASPFSHTAGVAMTYTVLAVGAGVVPQDWFSIDKWREAGRLGVTFALLVPTMIDILLSAGALADVQPKALQYGASPIHPETLEAALRALPNTRFVQIFGQTEVSPICCLSHEDHMLAINGRPELLTTVGKPVLDVELKVEHPDSEGIGQLILRSPHAYVVDDDGWRRTGDFGRIDDEGYVTLSGRVNDKIVRGGENIYPVEVETALISHPAVREAAVVGAPDRRYGEIVKAVVVLDDTQPAPTVEELQLHVRNLLAHFKTPAIVLFADELPRNASGKVLRRKLI